MAKFPHRLGVVLLLIVAGSACGTNEDVDSGTDSATGVDANIDTGVDADAGPTDGSVMVPDSSVPEVPLVGARHVDPDEGDDANDGLLVDEGGTGPWLTLPHAIPLLEAGETLYLRAGRHVVSSTIELKFDGSSGTAESPIRVAGYPGEEATIDGDGGTVIALDNKSHWIFERFTVENYRIFADIGEDVRSANNIFRNLVARTAVGGDNVAFVRFGGNGDGTQVEGCDIEFMGDPTAAHQNTAGLFFSRAEVLTFRGNRIHNFPIGIYSKHRNEGADGGAATDILIERNFVTGCTRNAMQVNAKYAVIRDNIFSNNSNIRVNEANGADGGDRNLFQHNLFHQTGVHCSADSQDDPLPGAQENVFLDNIFVDAHLSILEVAGESHGTETNYNLYDVGLAVSLDRTDYDLAGWRALESMDAESLEGAPTFVGGAATDAYSGFELTPDSLGSGAASDGSDLGPRHRAGGG